MTRFNKYRLVSSILIFFFFSLQVFCQDIKQEPKLHFGFQISSVLPNNLIQSSKQMLIVDTMRYEITLYPSYLLGSEIKYDFSKHFSFQTGINYIRRLYNTQIYNNDAVIYKTRLNFIGYEIPFIGLAYLRLSKHIYMDNAIGYCVNMYPSNIKQPYIYALRKSWLQSSLLANVGWEYRTNKAVYFFIGTSYQLHVTKMLYVLYYNSKIYGTAHGLLKLSGSYFSINVKYYLPQNKTL